MHFHTIFPLSGGFTQAMQLLAALSILVILHEFGHFFFARLFKTRVEKFYLFFDFLFPFSGLLNFALFKKKKGDTEYGIGWFPLGGYVKIAGMIDESMDKEQLRRPPEPWEFRAKKAWQRLLIMLGGIMMNILVAIILYIFVFGVWGENYLPTLAAKYGIAADSVAQSIGLRNGDMITGVDGRYEPRFNHIALDILINQATTVQVVRDGQPLNIELPPGSATVLKIIKDPKNSFIMPRYPVAVNVVSKTSEAARMGLMPDDSIIALNNTPVRFFDEFNTLKSGLKGQPVALTIVRHNQIKVLQGTLPKDGAFGFVNKGPENYFDYKYLHYNPVQAVGRGFSFTFEQFSNYWSQMKLMFSSKEIASKSVGGVISFGKLFSPDFDIREFLMLTAFISIILAFMNLLPVPGLDGGYVLFLLFEILTGRRVNEKVMEIATTVGLVLLVGLILYANGLDVFRLLHR